MEHIILNYLNKNYRFTLSTYSSYFVRDRINDSNVKLVELSKDLREIFLIDDDTLIPLLDKWCEQQITLLNNRVVQIQEELYKKGISVEIVVDQMNSMLF